MNLRHQVDVVRLVGRGLATWIPGFGSLLDQDGGGKTRSAAYCYGVWLKHLTLLWQHGMRTIPGDVLELGAGASLGTGLAALLSGADRYVALDTVRYAQPERDVLILRELVRLFRGRAARPAKGWPDYDAYLDEALFPSQIVGSELLSRSLAPERLARLEAALASAELAPASEPICYRAWRDPEVPGDHRVDLVFSHVVLQHVADLAGTYAECRRWLKPGGWMSHQIDHSCHGLTQAWDGHRQFGERTWRMIAGHRPYFLNREPCSTHVRLLRENGFELVALLRDLRSEALPRERLARRWRDLPEEDARTRGTFLLARAP